MSKPSLIFASDTDDDSIRLDSGSSMNNGVVTITKTLYFRVPEGENPRQYNDLDVYSHPAFPQMYSALAEDPRYTFYGNATIEHERAESKFFRAYLEYSTQNANATDVDGKPVTSDTKPWKLAPDNIEITYPEKNVAFEASYNDTGKLYDENGNALLPVVNSAGSPLLAERTILNMQLSFTFAVKKWDIDKALKYGNSTNSKSIMICGYTIPRGQGILKPPEATFVTTYDGDKVKWQYWSVRVSILIDTSGLLVQQPFLDIGDKANFGYLEYYDDLIQTSLILPATTQPEQICRFRKYKAVNLTKQGDRGGYTYCPIDDIVYCSWSQFLAFRNAAIAESNSLSDPTSTAYDSLYKGGMLDPQCEQLSQMPLNNGFLDKNAINSKKYRTLTFRQYPAKSWSSLDLPSKGMK